MKTLKSFLLALTILSASRPLQADPVIQSFEIWGKGTELDKTNVYLGWTNGFLMSRGSQGLELATCLDRITYAQARAMIDRRYKDHPELWSRPLGEQILAALYSRGRTLPGEKSLISYSLAQFGFHSFFK